MSEFCEHVYEYMNAPICPKCGLETHEPDWEEQNKMHKQWLKDNPDAWKTVTWWSI